jgi:hypothetical protein
MCASYPAVETKLTDILQRIAECDKEISHINATAPSGEPLRLREVELAARDLEHFTRAAPSIAHGLKLPHWEEPSRLAWPPPRQFDPALFAAMPFNRRYSADWGLVMEAEARAAAKLLSARQGP